MLTNYEKRKAQIERIGTPLYTFVVTIRALTDIAKEILGKESELNYDYYYDISGSEDEVRKEIEVMVSKFIYENRPQSYWRLEKGKGIVFYNTSDLKKGRDYEIEITKKKNKIPKPITFKDIKAL